jgi:hypothetical protein
MKRASKRPLLSIRHRALGALATSLLVLPAIGCASFGANDAAPASGASAEPPLRVGRIEGWGTLREVLRDGKTQARVDATKLASADVYGVGAAAGLDGEITLVGGEGTISRVADGALRTTSFSADAAEPVEASMLFVSRIDSWLPIDVTEDIDPADLDDRIGELAKEHGLAVSEPFLFRVVGDLTAVRYHVLNGQCPIRARMLGETIAPENAPLEAFRESTSGELLGIYATDQPGVLTHHGERMHLHAVAKDEDGARFTAHVESVGVRAGSTIYLPAAR